MRIPGRSSTIRGFVLDVLAGKLRIVSEATQQSVATFDGNGLVAGKGYVNHGAVAGTARPTGFTSIEWVGSVTPTNAIDGDTWIDTT